MRSALSALLVVIGVGFPSPGEPVLKRYWVEESHAIVIGRLTAVAVKKDGKVQRGTGTVVVERVVTGPVERNARVPFAWSHSKETAAMCPPSFDFRQVEGQVAIWFLERDPDLTVRPSGEFWLLNNVDSLQYHDTQLQHMPPSERRAAVWAVIREYRQTVK